MKHGIKAVLAVLALSLVLAACHNPAEPTRPDLDLYLDVTYSAQNPAHSANLQAGNFFTVAGPINLAPGANYANYVTVTIPAGAHPWFKDHAQAIQIIKDSFEFSRLAPISGTAAYKAYTAYPYAAANKEIVISDVQVQPGGTTFRITLELEATVSDVIELRVNAEKLVGAHGEQMDANRNLIAGEPEDDYYQNIIVTGPSVTDIGTGAVRNPRAYLTLTAPAITYITRPEGTSDVQAAITWSYARSTGYLDEDGDIRNSLNTHVVIEKLNKESAEWEAVPAADWTPDPLTPGQYFRTATTPASPYDIYRLNLTGRKELVTTGDYFGFPQRPDPRVANAVPDVQELVAPSISGAAKFTSGTATTLTPNWTNAKGGWLDLTVDPGLVGATSLEGIMPETLVKENFRLYAATGATAADVLAPPRGIPVDSVSQYHDGTDYHIIIRFDPEYKQGAGFDAAYGDGAPNNATHLQLWIANVGVYINGGFERLLGSGVPASILRTDGIEDFFALFATVTAANL
jgi:hypothetical protein